jgi:hypothetical protein
MKSFLSLVAVCAVVSLAGCQSTKSSSVAPGAVGEKSSACCASKSACTAEKNGEVSPGAMGEKSGCCKSAAKNGAVAPGAMSDEKANCAKVCPATGQTVSPGAVSEKKSGCCASKSSCTDKKIDG